ARDAARFVDQLRAELLDLRAVGITRHVAPRVRGVRTAHVARGPRGRLARRAGVELGHVRRAIRALPTAAEAQRVGRPPVEESLVGLRVLRETAGLEVGIAGAELELEVAYDRVQDFAVELRDVGRASGRHGGEEQLVRLEQARV